MSSGHTSRSYLLTHTAQDVGESADSQAVSEVFKIGADMRLSLRIDLMAESGTYNTAITAMLQTSHDGSTWIDGKTTTISDDGNVTINYLPQVSDDQADLPLRPLGRVVIDSGSGDAVTISQVWVAEVL